MNAHEAIDRLGSKSPRFKIGLALVIAAVIIGALVGAGVIGYRWAKSNAEAERTSQDDKIAVLTASGEQRLANVAQLVAENALLKKQNEAKAESQVQADTTRERKALADQANLDAERAEKFSEIDADKNFESQLRATCEEYRKKNFKLSFCARFEVNQ